MHPHRALIVAGATGYGVWPENSLEGLRRCLAAPLDGVEIDVQMTADGHVIAHHDYWLDPDATRLDGVWLTARSAPIKTMSLAEIQRHDVGALRPGSAKASRHPHLQSMDGVRPPTLPALLAALRAAPGPARRLYVEIKTDPQNPVASPDPEAVTEAVLRDLDAAGWTAHSKIIAFDWQVLRLARERAPGIATAHLTIPAALAHRVKPLPNGDSPWADGCDPRRHGGSDLAAIAAHGGEEWSPHFSEVTAERMAEAAALGLKVGPWNLARGEDISRMIALGVFSATVSGPDWGRGRRP